MEEEEKTTELITVKKFKQFLESYLNVNEEHRYGQGLFNCAKILHPVLVSKVTGTSSDPFFADSRADDRVIRFWFYLFDNNFFE